MNVLSLTIVAPGPGTLVQVRPVVDGQDILAVVFDGFDAEDPNVLLSMPKPTLTATSQPRQVRLAEAGCTEGCCGAIYVTIQLDGDEVVWNQWRNPIEESVELDEMRFDAGQYRAEIERAAADFSWEWPARTVARLLEAELRRHGEWLAPLNTELQGVVSWQPGQVSLLFLHPPRTTILTELPWLQFRIDFAVTGDDPAKQALGYAGMLLASDPRAIGKVAGGSEESAERLGYRWER